MSIPAGDSRALGYVMKVVSTMEKTPETSVNRRNVEKPQPSLYLKRGTARRLFQKLSEKTPSLRQQRREVSYQL